MIHKLCNDGSLDTWHEYIMQQCINPQSTTGYSTTLGGECDIDN